MCILNKFRGFKKVGKTKDIAKLHDKSLSKYSFPSGQFLRLESPLIWPFAPMLKKELPHCLAKHSDSSIPAYSSLVLAKTMLLNGNVCCGTGAKPLKTLFSLSSLMFGGATSRAPLIISLVFCAHKTTAMQARLWATITTSPFDSLTYFSMVSTHSLATG